MRGWPLIKLLPTRTNLKFVKFSKAFGALSAVLVIASIVGCFYPGLNMGIDFRGGILIEIRTPTPPDLATVRSEMGRAYPLIIGGRAITEGDLADSVSQKRASRFSGARGEAENSTVVIVFSSGTSGCVSRSLAGRAACTGEH